MNPDTIGYVWTGQYDLNTLRVDGEIFESGKKKLRIQKYLCFGPFCKFFGDFLIYLEINSFSERISKIYGNRKF